jgi:hypothetical protein
MTAFTETVLCQVELEVMRGMAFLASRPAMEGVLARCGLVAAAAGARQRSRLFPSGMRVVASEAGGPRDALGMLCVHVPMALRAGRPRGRTYVVRSVAARADGVGWNLGLPEHDHVGVARTAGHGLLGFQLVRSMAAHALLMPAREQRRCRHNRLGLLVALGASRQRVNRWRVLVRVARRAHKIR